jgi:hypothetical protein
MLLFGRGLSELLRAAASFEVADGGGRCCNIASDDDSVRRCGFHGYARNKKFLEDSSPSDEKSNASEEKR